LWLKSGKCAGRERAEDRTLARAGPQKEKRMCSLDDRTGNVLTAVTIFLLAATILKGEMV
jgi:hypothetical protein